MSDDECPLSQRVDGPLHSWQFDGDDPYVVCVYCDQMQNALTGRVLREGRVEPRAESDTCPACGRIIAVRVPRGGDGSLWVFVAHGPRSARCPGSGQSA